MPVGVRRWWQELTHPCKYLKNNNWRTSRLFLPFIDNKNNSLGLVTQWPSQSRQWSAIDTSSQSVIHKRQLRQPGDYLKHNRAGLLPPHVHTFRVEKTIRTPSSKNRETPQTINHSVRELNRELKRELDILHREIEQDRRSTKLNSDKHT